MTPEDVERLVDAHDEIVKELGTFLRDGPARQETKRQADKTKAYLMSAIRSLCVQNEFRRIACGQLEAERDDLKNRMESARVLCEERSASLAAAVEMIYTLHYLLEDTHRHGEYPRREEIRVFLAAIAKPIEEGKI